MTKGGVTVHPGHVAGMAGLMDGVAGRYDSAAGFSTQKATPQGNGWTGLLTQLKGPLAEAAGAFAGRQKVRAQDARTTKGKLVNAAQLYSEQDAANATALRSNGMGGDGSDGDGGGQNSDVGADIAPEQYPSVGDLDFHDPKVEDSQQQDDLKNVVHQLASSGVDGAIKKLTGKGLVEEVLTPFVAQWPELVRIGQAYSEFGRVENQTMAVVDSGRRQLGENWDGDAHDAADEHLKDRIGGGDAPIGVGMAQLLLATHDGIEQAVQGLVQYLQDGLSQQGTYRGQPVTISQLAVNADHLPSEVAESLQDPLTTFAQNALEYVQTGQDIIDQAKAGIAQLSAGNADVGGAINLIGAHQAGLPINAKDDPETGDGSPENPKRRSFTATKFQQRSVLVGGKPQEGRNPPEYIGGIRADEGVPVGGYEYFGDAFVPPNDQHPDGYDGAVALPYRINPDTGLPEITGAPIGMDDVESHKDDTNPGLPHWRDLAIGQVELKDRPPLLFTNQSSLDLPNAQENTTIAYKGAGGMPLQEAVSIPGLVNVEAVQDPSTGQVIISGNDYGSPTRGVWLTPAPSSDNPDDWTFLNRSGWTHLGDVTGYSEPASMFSLPGAPDNPTFGMITSGQNNTMELRLGSTPQELASASPIPISDPVYGSYSPHVQNIIPHEDGSYTLVLSWSIGHADNGAQALTNTYEVVTGTVELNPN